MNGTDLLVGLWLSALGSAYLLYGRKQSAPIPLICGLLLIAEPYLVRGTTMQLLVGLALAVVPFVRR